MPNGLNSGLSADLILSLKTEARLLHKEAQQDNAHALDRIRRQCPSLKLGMELQRKHCLATIGRELGFDNWKSALDCFSGAPNAVYGAFLHPRRCYVHWNIWFADLTEARRVRIEHGGFLLAYKHQYMIVDRDYIVSLGLDPDCEEWSALGRDWTHADGAKPRAALMARIVEAHMNWHKGQLAQHGGNQQAREQASA